MTDTPDITFNPDCLYGSTAWVARTLGMSPDNFYKKKASLHKEGFPRPDPLNGKRYIKADVYAWVTNRRQISDGVKIEGSTDSMEVNFDEL